MTGKVQNQICEKCKGVGWVVDPKKNSAKKCSCRVKEYKDANLTRAGIPTRYNECTLENFETLENKTIEKALKAALQSFQAEAWGHSVTELLKAVAEKAEVAESLMQSARNLDRYYIPARYPNGYAQGKPSDYILERDAEDATRGAEEILRFCNGLLAG